jgi:hypothetical protein
MSLSWSGRLFGSGSVADPLEHEKRQMQDQAPALLRMELTIKARRPMGLRAPEFYLI